MTNAYGAKLDAMMVKIRGLLANADDPANPPAAQDTYRAKAEQLMQQYRIEEEHLIEQGGLVADEIRPLSREVPLCNADSPYYNTYYNIMLYVMQHCGVRGKYGWKRDEEGRMTLAMTLVGYEADLRFTEEIYQNARLVFADRMEPKREVSLSDEENIYRMRNAGMERIKIARIMGYGDTTSATAKVTRLYKKACNARGEDATLTGRDMSVTAFKEAYVSGFLGQLRNNLWRARNAADTGGGELVLANRKDRVNEVFYDMFPSERPSDKPAKASGRRRSGWSASDEARYRRMQGAAGQAGAAAGRQAASEVNVGGVKPSKRLKD